MSTSARRRPPARAVPVAITALLAVAIAACSVTDAVFTQIHVLNRTSTPVEVRAPSGDRFVAPACGEGYRVNFDASEAAVTDLDGTRVAVIGATVPEGRVVLQRLWVVLTPDSVTLYPDATAPPPDLPSCDGPARPLASPTGSVGSGTRAAAGGARGPAGSVAPAAPPPSAATAGSVAPAG